MKVIFKMKKIQPLAGINYNDQTYSCPRDWCFSTSYGCLIESFIITEHHHSTMVSRGLRGILNWATIMLRGILFFPSHGRIKGAGHRTAVHSGATFDNEPTTVTSRSHISNYRIFLLFLPWLPCHFYLVVIEKQQL